MKPDSKLWVGLRDPPRGEEATVIRKLVNLLPAISLAVAMLASHPAAAAASAPTVVETINGGGTASMCCTTAAGLKSVSSFGVHATLYSDGTATGHFDCVDLMGDTMPGNVFGPITSWSRDTTTGDIILQITDGSLVGTHGSATFHGGRHPHVTIQSFGGAGVGHWTLTNALGVVVCDETLISGQLVERLS
jgi:hypothetical protein